MLLPLLRRGASLTSAGALALAAFAGAVPAQAAASAQAAAVSENLVCVGHMTVTLATPVTYTPAQNTFKVTGAMDDCMSPSGSNPRVAGGSFSMTGSGLLSCTRLETYKLEQNFTWYDAQGAKLGETRVSATGTGKGDPAHHEMLNVNHGIAAAGSTRFAGQEVESEFAPKAAVGSCDEGKNNLTGSIQVSIRPAR
ncbi:hypothetical protein ACQEVS_03505 [Streptomyces sp. CA-181903]|uniref:hypothetical protein n=1 Tax=Streptomyces sp. CA-181903 TaxID=3240055 RepID=UPI003D8F1E3A